MIATLMLMAILAKPVATNEVKAIVLSQDSEVVAVNVGTEIYEFYGSDFHMGDEITLIMIGDKIVGVK